ncbi:MAG: PAS domain-containing sensor histidine kinase, partial [Nanoarchaeota archaeon]|nr:PAS domain-containing sensor histidine kinase [Nanoarchaeota archaeon]
GVEGIARDITKQKKTEEDLKKAHDFSQSLIDTAQTIILVLSPEGKIISFNPYMEKVSGYKLTEVKGKDWFKTFLPKQDFSHIRVLFKKAISNIQTIGNVNPIVTKSRELVYIEWHDKTLKDRTGKVIGLLSIGLDVTKLKKAYDELKKIDELKSNAIRDLTHEFKTPVSKIQMASNILQAYIKNPVEKRENINKYLDIIKKNTAFAIRQVSQTLEFSKLQELEGIQKTPVIFCDLLKDMAKAYHPKKITIVTATHTDKKFKLNKEMMKTLVRNLLENAIKFTKKGTIRLSCSFKDNNLVFAVEDTGIGIRKEDMEQVKKPFTQLDPSIQGMGIGLALCQKIVQLHSGTLDIMSTFGKGTKVTIMIPEAKHEKKHIDS